MVTGKVRMWDANRGFGFITPDNGAVDLFVHINAVADGLDALQVGTRVSFNERPSKKKPGSYEAIDVQVII